MSTIESGYPMSETPCVPLMERPRSSPSSMSSSYDRSSPAVYTNFTQAGYYSHASTPYHCPPVTPFSRVENVTPYSAYATTPAPVGGQSMPLTATPTAHLSAQRPYTAHSYGPSTAAPSVLFRQPHSLYGSPSSSISSYPYEKELAHTPPPLDLSRRSSEVSIHDHSGGYFMPAPQTTLFPPTYGMGAPVPDYGPLKPEAQIKKRSRTAQACEKCRIRKAKCSGGQPCTRCINKKLPCVFSGTTRSRGAARFKGELGPNGHVVGASASKLGRRHSLDDPFATPTAASVRDVRRHSEGSVEPHLTDDSGSGALRLDLTPQSHHTELSRPSTTEPVQSWAPLPTPTDGTYYYTMSNESSGFPWTPESPAVQLQQYSMGYYSAPSTAPSSAGSIVAPSFAEWHGQQQVEA